MALEYGSLPFTEAINYLQQKINLPTQSWTDIWEGEHTKAFVVAGATKAELLADLRGAIDTSIRDGMTLAQFRDQFDEIVKRHGWAYNGGRNWRSRVIYQTNMRTAYQAGRYQQQQATKARRPFWQYVHSDLVTHPRPEHLAWNGLVLGADDKWWDTHYPPNGWGCECTVRALSNRDLVRLGKDGPDQAPEIVWEDKTVGVRGPNPRTVRVPEGIDPGWGYNVGKAASGNRLPDDVMQMWFDSKGVREPTILTGFKEAGRPERIPKVPLPIPTGPILETQEAMTAALEVLLQGPSKVFDAKGTPIEVDAARLARHIFETGDVKRSEYFPLIEDAITKPYEIWVNFDRHKGTGKYRVVATVIKAYELRGGRQLVFVSDGVEGSLVSLTMFITKDNAAINRRRQGILVYKQAVGNQT